MTSNEIGGDWIGVIVIACSFSFSETLTHTFTVVSLAVGQAAHGAVLPIGFC